MLPVGSEHVSSAADHTGVTQLSLWTLWTGVDACCAAAAVQTRLQRWHGEIFSCLVGARLGSKQNTMAWHGMGCLYDNLLFTNMWWTGEQCKKVKVSHTRLPSVGLRSWSLFLAVSLHVTWVINLAVGCHYFPPGLQLPSQPYKRTATNCAAWWTKARRVWTVCLMGLLQLWYEHDSATTRYEVFRALAYEIVYENHW